MASQKLITLQIPTPFLRKILNQIHYAEDTEGVMYSISVRLPGWMLDALDYLVEKKIFISRSEAIRVAIRKLIREYSDLSSSPQ